MAKIISNWFLKPLEKQKLFLFFSLNIYDLVNQF